MRLCSIINVWACCIELLPFCISNHLKFCDAVIVVGSVKSNRGENSSAYAEFISSYPVNPRVLFESIEPEKGYTPLLNETRKRNYGISLARKNNYGFTHFLMADADEFYNPEYMEYEKKRFDGGLNGLVHEVKVYIKTPTLYCSDHTLVPGIHKLGKDTYVGGFKEYPYAYDKNGNAHVDPSRRPNYISGIAYSEVPMMHFSYVRKDINLKINNSSANLKRSKSIILEELRDAKPGYVSRLYHQELKECENYFNIQI